MSNTRNKINFSGHSFRCFIGAMQLPSNGLIYGAVLLVVMLIAAKFPMMNDETYYIAFSKDLQMSYVDHPPFVAYLNIVQTMLGLHFALVERSLVLVLHLISTLFLMGIVYNHSYNDKALATKLLITFLIAYLVPVFGFFSIFILPDTGLLLSLSVLLWVADKVILAHDLSSRHVVELGIGLGIGLLSKYHILLLGGGIIGGVFLDLTRYSGFKWSTLFKMLVSVLIGLVIALPMLIWNVNNHFASFVFQLQHGLSANQWHLKGCLVFILVSTVYLTPWFTFKFLKQGLFGKLHAYLLIPVCGLFIIFFISSLRKHVLPQWISPAFWLLIPYSVIYCGQGGLSSLMKACKYTALIWVPLVIALLLPGGMWNLKPFLQWVRGNTPNSWCTLFWEELPGLVKNDKFLAPIIAIAFDEAKSPGCKEKQPVIATLKRIWASQLEYHQVFPGAKILNLEQGSSNFYLWRDEWADYANCNIVFLAEGTENLAPILANLLTVKHEYHLVGVGNYSTLNLQVLSGTLNDSDTIQHLQRSLLENPHY